MGLRGSRRLGRRGSWRGRGCGGGRSLFLGCFLFWGRGELGFGRGWEGGEGLPRGMKARPDGREEGLEEVEGGSLGSAMVAVSMK